MAGDRLMCYRPKEWEKLEREHASHEAWWRFIAAATMYRIDKKGRIILVRAHIDRSLMRRDAVCVGFVDHFEICSSSSLMDKYIRTVFPLNKTIAFFFVKPFDNSISHRDTPPFFFKKIFMVPNFRRSL